MEGRCAGPYHQVQEGDSLLVTGGERGRGAGNAKRELVAGFGVGGGVSSVVEPGTTAGLALANGGFLLEMPELLPLVHNPGLHSLVLSPRDRGASVAVVVIRWIATAALGPRKTEGQKQLLVGVREVRERAS